MTQAERASLERLEDMLTKRLDGIAGDVKAIDVRTRGLEITVAGMQGADGQRDKAGQSRVQWVGIALSIGLIFVAVPASVLAILNIVQAVGG